MSRLGFYLEALKNHQHASSDEQKAGYGKYRPDPLTNTFSIADSMLEIEVYDWFKTFTLLETTNWNAWFMCRVSFADNIFIDSGLTC